MIYFVSGQRGLFENDSYKCISVEKSLELLNTCEILQFDTETNGRDCHINQLLCIQFGSKIKDFQIVIDTTSISILLYKDILENKFIVGQNLKFDLQFLYNYNIVPKYVYDTMIVEQLLYLGYPYTSITPKEYKEYNYDFPYLINEDLESKSYGNYELSFSLKALGLKYVNVDIDKSTRGEIIWRGLDTKVILYAANDVVYLEDIMNKQVKSCKDKNCLKAAKLECDFVPVISYLEWCGIKLDENKWLAKMANDKNNLLQRKKELDNFVINNPLLSKYTKLDLQGDLFSGFQDEPQCIINWDSSKQVVNLAKDLGFDTKVQDKKTGEDKDSVLEKVIKNQKGINDKFLELYFDYKESSKVVSTYGQGHLNLINPNTGRLHTVYKQLGASSGRMSCGSKQPNTDLAKLKKIKPSECTFVNIQQLPADEATRSSFVSEKGNIFCSCDYSAMESYLGADIYDDKEFQNEFLYGSKDTHSLFAWMVFRKECESLGCTCVADVKKKAPQWRKAVKAVEFAYMFGAAAPTIAQSANCSVEQAQEYIDRLDKGFSGISKFAKEGAKFVRNNGYIIINKYTGHKMYWWDHAKWLKRQSSFTKEFWDDYKINHKGTNSIVAQEVREHFQAAGKYDRLARNSPTQGSGACITKLACINFFKWIINNNLFNKVKIVAIVHDEVCIEYPKELSNTNVILEKYMEDASKEYCKFSKIPTESSVGTHWIH